MIKPEGRHRRVPISRTVLERDVSMAPDSSRTEAVMEPNAAEFVERGVELYQPPVVEP